MTLKRLFPVLYVMAATSDAERKQREAEVRAWRNADAAAERSRLISEPDRDGSS